MALQYTANLLPFLMWGVITAPSPPIFDKSAQLIAFAEIQDLCESTGGNWHNRLLRCTCPANELFWIQYGCEPAPDLSNSVETSDDQTMYLGPYDLHVQTSPHSHDDFIRAAIAHNQADVLLPGITLYDANEGPSLVLSNILSCVMGPAKVTWLSNAFVDADIYISPWAPVNQQNPQHFDVPGCIEALGNTGLADAGMLCRVAETFLSHLVTNKANMQVRDHGVWALQGNLYDSQQQNLFEWLFSVGSTPVRYRIHAYDGVILQRHVQVLSRQARLVLYLSAQGSMDAAQLDIYTAVPEWTQYFSSQWQSIEASCHH